MKSIKITWMDGQQALLTDIESLVVGKEGTVLLVYKKGSLAHVFPLFNIREVKYL